MSSLPDTHCVYEGRKSIIYYCQDNDFSGETIFCISSSITNVS